MDLEKELTCSICTDLLYQPLTLLDCLHTFCGACLKEWFSWQAIAAESRHAPPPRPGAAVFTCPSCRAAVRSTKHNATVATLLDMVLATNPEKRKSADEQAEMDAKYRPGDEVLPKLNIPTRSPEQQRLDEAEQRLIDEVRERSRQEAVAAAAGTGTGGSSHHSRSRSRSHARHRSSSRATRSTRPRQGLLTPADAEAAVVSALEDDGRGGERRHHRSASSRSTDGERIVGHQSSLRLLISGSEANQGPTGSGSASASSSAGSRNAAATLDIEREIEEFARQIQEEGLLDGLDLDNIDPANNDELSRKIAEAYDRRQRERSRAQQQQQQRRHHRRDTSDVSRTSATASDTRHHSGAPDPSPRSSTLAVPASGASASAGSGSSSGGRSPPSASSRTSSRQRSYSQSSQEVRPSARPPPAAPVSSSSPSGVDVEIAEATEAAAIAAAAAAGRTNRQQQQQQASSSLLDVQDATRYHQRRRTASEGRASAPRLPPKTTTTINSSSSRPAARSQTDLPLRPAELAGDDFVLARPVELPGSPASATSGASRPSTSVVGSVAQQQQRTSSLPSQPFPAELPASSGSGASGGGTASFKSRAFTLGLELPGPPQPLPQELPSSLPPPVAAAQLVQSPTVADRYGTAALSSSPRTPNFPQQPSQPPPPPPTFQQQQQQQQQQHRRQHSRPVLYPEPDIHCARCSRKHIEYDVHYNCAICRGGDWNICLDCYRQGRGCEHWFGFGYSAWHKWEKEKARQAAQAVADGKLPLPPPPPLEKPHMLTANRYLPPPVLPGGAEGRRTLTPDNPEDRLQSGVFCAGCQAWANSCYWRCDVCNQGDWGFCNDCVNQGRVCTHPLLPLTHEPVEAVAATATATAVVRPPRPLSSSLLASSPGDGGSGSLAGPGSNSNNAFRIGSFRALTFLTTCDHCRATIAPASARYHCYACTSTVVPDTQPGDYDLCEHCYTVVLPGSGLLADENGAAGWRRCPKAGHRMVVVAFRETASESSGKVSSRVSSIPRRVVLQDLVGGWRLETEDATVPPPPPSSSSSSVAHEGAGATAIAATAAAATAAAAAAAATPAVQMWSIWFNGARQFERLVSCDVQRNAPPSAAAGAGASFPPAGGVGMAGVARWAYYPEAGADDELAFPKHAEVREIEDVNGEWFHGVYMGRRGLFPGSFVHILRKSGQV